MNKAHKNLTSALAVLAVVAFGGPAFGQVFVNVPNGSFESPASTSADTPFVSSPGNDTTAPVITGWNAAMSDPNNSNSYGLANNSQLASPGTSDGSQSAVMQVYFNYTYSTLTSASPIVTITPNTTYTLTVSIGALANPTTFDGVNGSVGETAAQADIYLLANGVQAAGFTLTNTSVPVGTMQDYTATFTTGASGGFIGQALTIQLEADKAFYPTSNYDPGDESILFDNVRLAESGPGAVPEPTTWALILGGLGFLVLVTRRKVRG